MSDEERPLTRSQSARLGCHSAGGDGTRENGPGGRDDGVQVERGAPVPHISQDMPGGQSGSVENSAIIDAVQSLGRTLAGYSARVMKIEEKLESILISTPVSASNGPQAPAKVESTPVSGQPSTECTNGGTRVGHFVKPGEFDGSAPWSSFIAQFRVIASAQGWSMGDRLAILVASLKGPALELFARLPETDQTDFSRLTEALKSRFAEANQEPWFRSQLRRRTRHANETLPHLAQEIERLISMAYPSATVELRDTLACDHFMDALNDTDLHIAVRQTRPSSLPQALAGAIEIEAIRAASGASTSLRPQVSEVLARKGQGPEKPSVGDSSMASDGVATSAALYGILRTLNDMQRALAESVPAYSGGRGAGGERYGAGSPRPCWGCGVSGHFRRHCPQNPRNFSGAGEHRNQGNE